MAKMTKAQCSAAGKSLAKTGSSSAGKALAQCRRHKKKAAPKKPKAAKAGVRQSRRLAGKGVTVRQPEPPKKPRKPAKKKKEAAKTKATTGGLTKRDMFTKGRAATNATKPATSPLP